MNTLHQNIQDETFTFTSFENEMPKGNRHLLFGKEIGDFTMLNHYSARGFRFNRRKKKNAQKSRIIVLDVDEPQDQYPTLKHIQERLSAYNHILATTKSHQILKNGITCDRYRIIVFMTNDIQDDGDYKHQVTQIAQYFNVNYDKHCVDLGRFFYHSKDVISSNFQGLSFINSNHIVTSVEADKEFRFWEADIEFPKEINAWINKKQLGKNIISKRERLIRILTCQKNLLIRYDLGQEGMSKYLNIKRDTFKSWLDDLIFNGWISVASHDYGKGYKAKSYRAEGQLAELIMHYFQFNDRRDSYSEITLPKTIKDGEWNRTIFLSSFKFQNDDTNKNFIRWVKTIPGWDKKTSLKEAYHAFESMKKYRSEPS